MSQSLKLSKLSTNVFTVVYDYLTFSDLLNVAATSRGLRRKAFNVFATFQSFSLGDLNEVTVQQICSSLHPKLEGPKFLQEMRNLGELSIELRETRWEIHDLLMNLESRRLYDIRILNIPSADCDRVDPPVSLNQLLQKFPNLRSLTLKNFVLGRNVPDTTIVVPSSLRYVDLDLWVHFSQTVTLDVESPEGLQLSLTDNAARRRGGSSPAKLVLPERVLVHLAGFKTNFRLHGDHIRALYHNKELSTLRISNPSGFEFRPGRFPELRVLEIANDFEDMDLYYLLLSSPACFPNLESMSTYLHSSRQANTKSLATRLAAFPNLKNYAIYVDSESSCAPWGYMEALVHEILRLPKDASLTHLFGIPYKQIFSEKPTDLIEVELPSWSHIIKSKSEQILFLIMKRALEKIAFKTVKVSYGDHDYPDIFFDVKRLRGKTAVVEEKIDLDLFSVSSFEAAMNLLFSFGNPRVERISVKPRVFSEFNNFPGDPEIFNNFPSIKKLSLDTLDNIVIPSELESLSLTPGSIARPAIPEMTVNYGYLSTTELKINHACLKSVYLTRYSFQMSLKSLELANINFDQLPLEVVTRFIRTGRHCMKNFTLSNFRTTAKQENLTHKVLGNQGVDFILKLLRQMIFCTGLENVTIQFSNSWKPEGVTSEQLEEYLQLCSEILTKNPRLTKMSVFLPCCDDLQGAQLAELTKHCFLSTGGRVTEFYGISSDLAIGTPFSGCGIQTEMIKKLSYCHF
eukprot:CAMPEP_0115023266 /NCGR_PEP_ID=MMETSP0216-20121206/32258_1 /TAXON_ID=223996 /ORGANISM="Protocruzia adherens, Strain Boccale" /LENGTH=741 /DNA_ID=CAMNT_0002396537 /DNA_START=104 /DNA_END=2329 /DNA_ORIENTATION=+